MYLHVESIKLQLYILKENLIHALLWLHFIPDNLSKRSNYIVCTEDLYIMLDSNESFIFIHVTFPLYEFYFPQTEHKLGHMFPNGAITNIFATLDIKRVKWAEAVNMMTSSNGNIFCVTGHLWGEFTGLRWIPRTKASDAELWYFLWSASE